VTSRVLVLAAVVGCSDPPAVPPDAEVLPSVLPELLSQTGIYQDIRAKTVSSRLAAFTPANVLWSDGADKQRWYQLPAGATID
jgi:hypothetical protein